MRWFKKKLPPPPLGPEPFVSTTVDKIETFDGQIFLIRSARSFAHFDGQYITGQVVDEKDRIVNPTTTHTLVPKSSVKKRTKMRLSLWSYKLVESPDERPWSDN